MKEKRARNMYTNIYPREKYLSRLRPFYSSDIIKVITGIRRCGKSCIMKAIINELLSNGVDSAHIIYIPLDKRGFKEIKKPEQLEARIESMISGGGLFYLFIDEVQNVEGFESVVQAYAEDGFSIFLTGSNSYLLSDEITTKLTGRYLTFETFPLDFHEFLEMKKFFNLNVSGDMDQEFNEYVLNGGFPKSLEFPDLNARRTYTRGIVSEIFEKDVKTRRRISNLAVYERVQTYLINNYGSPVSLGNLLSSLEKEGMRTKASTVRRYIEDLKKAKIIYECNRFDLKSRKAIRRDQKYYLADMSLYFSMNTDNQMNYGPTLENLVYLYLVSNNYQVSFGKVGNLECDFICRDQEQNYAYIQVTYSLHGGSREADEKIQEREYRPFRLIRDGYPRYIISLDKYRDQREGVHHINAIDLFLGKVSI
ncbi:MAG: ATP-binding protein [Galactobacillus timonensis]|jgi:predicted AAA+ superfamily ATPase|uniref:ATP-binding protein n=1 Tax=Galactobacillus timonensis TaxID=2041840 RepID=UPI0031599C05|nr:ATP-binding protein [Galactobacillus timonensis]